MHFLVEVEHCALLCNFVGFVRRAMEGGVNDDASREKGAPIMETQHSGFNGSPERPQSSTAQASSLDTAKEPLFPTPLRNKIAKVAAKEADPYFDQELEGEENETRYLYKEMGPFAKDVAVKDASKFVAVSETGPTWTALARANPSERTNFFRTLVLSVCPSHLAPSFDQPIQLPFLGSKTNNCGRKRKTDLVIGLSGHCSSKQCPTTFDCGFTETTIKSLLVDEPPTMIELTVVVQNACCHVKGDAYGHLKGHERQRQIDELNGSKLKPGGFAKTKLAAMTDSQFHSGNRAVTTTRNTAYNLAREAKVKALKESGFTDCKMHNIAIARDKCKEEDISARCAARDRSQDIPGILRSFNFAESFHVYLWTKTACCVFHRLCQGGKTVVHMDATGQMLNFPLSESLNGKILHTKVAVKPLYSLVDPQHMRDKTVAGK